MHKYILRLKKRKDSKIVYDFYDLCSFIIFFLFLLKILHLFSSCLHFLAISYKDILDCAFHEYYYLNIYALKCLNVKILFFFFHLSFPLLKNLFTIKYYISFKYSEHFMNECSSKIYLEYNLDFKIMHLYQYFKYKRIFH